jgi:hypothetical protein
MDGLSDQFKAYDLEATRVPNAYVNPLGDYLAGVIQEIVSYEQPSLRNNSRIAYTNAAALCGRSAQLTAAAAAMARPRVPANERVLHVIVGEGFSPERDVMSFGLNLKSQIVPIKIPVFKPVPSSIDRIALEGPNGTLVASLDPIGDFEAIRLRDQHDRVPETMVGVMTSTLAAYFEGKGLQNLGILGQVASAVRNTAAQPDTRSWLSLPRRFHVARITLPRKPQPLILVARDARGAKVGSHDLSTLPTETQSIVYGRATDDGIQLQAARKLWIDGRLEDAA